NVEEGASFDDFETLVHQGGGVDGDALAHFPGRVVQRLLYGDGGEFGFGSFEEGATGGGEPDALDFVHAAAAEALVDGIMFAINGKERLAGPAGGGGDQLAGSDQALFVGEADGLAGFDSFVGGFETGDAHDGA